MARFTSNGNGGDAVGAIVLGSLAFGAGILAIDHHYSPKGHSVFDRIAAKLTGASSPHAVGAAAVDTKEIAKLPAYAQQVIQKALASETDPTALTQLAANLASAGMPNTAAAVRGKLPASSTGFLSAWRPSSGRSNMRSARQAGYRAGADAPPAPDASAPAVAPTPTSGRHMCFANVDVFGNIQDRTTCYPTKADANNKTNGFAYPTSWPGGQIPWAHGGDGHMLDFHTHRTHKIAGT